MGGLDAAVIKAPPSEESANVFQNGGAVARLLWVRWALVHECRGNSWGRLARQQTWAAA